MACENCKRVGWGRFPRKARTTRCRWFSGSGFECGAGPCPTYRVMVGRAGFGRVVFTRLGKPLNVPRVCPSDRPTLHSLLLMGLGGDAPMAERNAIEEIVGGLAGVVAGLDGAERFGRFRSAAPTLCICVELGRACGIMKAN